MTNKKLVFWLIAAFAILNAGLSKSEANQPKPEVYNAVIPLINEVQSLVNLVAAIEQKEKGSSEHVQFSLDINAANAVSLGLTLDTSFSATSAQEGFIITAVDSNSTAALLGLKSGEIITRINSERVNEYTAKERLSTLLSLEDGDVLNLTIINEALPSASRLRTVSLMIESVTTPQLQIVVGQP